MGDVLSKSSTHQHAKSMNQATFAMLLTSALGTDLLASRSPILTTLLLFSRTHVRHPLSSTASPPCAAAAGQVPRFVVRRRLLAATGATCCQGCKGYGQSHGNRLEAEQKACSQCKLVFVFVCVSEPAGKGVALSCGILRCIRRHVLLICYAAAKRRPEKESARQFAAVGHRAQLHIPNTTSHPERSTHAYSC